MKHFDGSANLLPDQINELKLGEKQGIDTKYYADSRFLAAQMRQIRLGLEEKLNVMVYANPEYDWFQMEEIRLGLKESLDVSKYADIQIPFLTMRQVRKGLKEGIDLSALVRLPAGKLRELRKAYRDKINMTKYIHAGYDEGQLSAIRHALKEGICVDTFVTPELSEQTITEMAKALKLNIQLKDYLDEYMEWRQLREVRLGLERRLPVHNYANSLYSWKQMREIRIGLQEDLDVSSYNSLAYTEEDMHEIRVRLEKAQCASFTTAEPGYFTYDQYMIMIDETRMYAYIITNDTAITETAEQLVEHLQQSGVVYGILKENIQKIVRGKTKESKILVARGKEPEIGADGYYEYRFDTEVTGKPLLLADGSVDYQNGKWFEEVKENQVIAIYHQAERGTPGQTVNGIRISGSKGKELPVLKGNGFRVNQKQNEYYATMNGLIEMKNEEIFITPVIVVREVSPATGNIHFEGTIHVLGDVLTGAKIDAGKDIFVDGSVEGADLDSGGDIIIQRGCNADGKGHIHANGTVRARFFENATVRAGSNVCANAVIHSDIFAENMVEVSGQKGHIIGGRVIAGNFITVQNLGNPSEMETMVSIQGHLVLKKKLLAYRKDKQDTQKALDNLIKIKEQLARKTKLVQQDATFIDTFAKVENSIRAMQEDVRELDKMILKTEWEKNKLERSEIEVRGTVYDGVSVVIGEIKWKTRQQLTNCIFYERNRKISVEMRSGR